MSKDNTSERILAFAQEINQRAINHDLTDGEALASYALAFALLARITGMTTAQAQRYRDSAAADVETLIGPADKVDSKDLN